MLDWVAERFQDALGSEELAPGLVPPQPHVPGRRDARIREFLELLRSGISPAPSPIAGPDPGTAGHPATMEPARRGGGDRAAGPPIARWPSPAAGGWGGRSA